MTERIPGLMGFVVRELKLDPDIRSGELYEKSLARYPDVRDMSVRQFHARYPLQAKRQLKNPVVRRFPVPKPPEQAEKGVEAGSAAAAQPRATAAGDGSARPPEEPRMPRREEVRLLFFRLAMDLETAHTRADVVDVMARLDRYVDEAMAIGARRGG